MTISFVLQVNFHREAPGIFGLTADFNGSILYVLLSCHSFQTLYIQLIDVFVAHIHDVNN